MRLKYAKKRKGGGAKALVKRAAVVAAFALLILIGLDVLFYPQLSDYINEKNASRVISTYDTKVSAMKKTDYSACLKAARAYNARLYSRGGDVRDAFSGARDDTSRSGEYWSLLNVDNDGMMGYIEIDKIQVKMPVYHGTDDAVLASGAGHLEGSSLPVGGADTHAVITAHTGLPSAELFTGLDRLKTGDTFALHVLGDTFTYRVDRILTVLPDQVDALRIVSGGDYVTLVTCTPYGINSHRLLVRGARIPNPPAPQNAGEARETQRNPGWFQQTMQKIFLAFAGAFEATVTFFVEVARRIMDLFHIAY